MSEKRVDADFLVRYVLEDQIHNGKLSCVFKSLTINSYGFYSTKHKKMSLQRFEYFVEDLFLYTSTFNKKEFLSYTRSKFRTEPSVSTIFATPHNRVFLSYRKFLELLVEISFLRRGNKRTLKSFKKLLQTIYRSEKYDQYKNFLPLSLWNELKDLRKLFFQYDAPLEIIFNHFSQFKNSKKNHEENGDQQERSDNASISYSQLVRTCQSLGITHGNSMGSLNRCGANFVSQFEIRKIYRTLFNHSFRCEPDHINFDTFKTFLTRLALFIYQKPSCADSQKPNHIIIRIFFQKFLHPVFKRLFGEDISNHLLNLDLITPPVLLEVIPDNASFEESKIIRIRGTGFDFRKGGVYVRFNTLNREIIVPCRYSKEEEDENDNNMIEYNNKKRESINSGFGTPMVDNDNSKEFEIFTPQTNSLFRQFKASNFGEIMNQSRDPDNYIKNRETEVIFDSPMLDPNTFGNKNDSIQTVVLVKKPEVGGNPEVLDPHYPRKRYRFCYEVRVFNYLRVQLSVSNDLEEYSKEKLLDFYFVDRLEPFLVGAEITVLLLEYFRTFKFLDVEKWECLKIFIREKLESQCIFKKPTKVELDMQYNVLSSIDEEEEDEKRKEKEEEEEDEKKKEEKEDEKKKRYVLGVTDKSKLFYPHSSNYRTKNGISLPRFIKLLVIFSLTEIQGLHPLDFLINLIQLHECIKNEEEYTKMNKLLNPIQKNKTTKRIFKKKKRRIFLSSSSLFTRCLDDYYEEDYTTTTTTTTTSNKSEFYIRHRREFDIYRGPLLIGMIFEKKNISTTRVGNNHKEDINNNCLLFRNGHREFFCPENDDFFFFSSTKTITMKKKKRIENSWFGYIEYNSMYKRLVMRVIEFSENFDHLIHRFLCFGFDITTSYKNTSTRNNSSSIGRNWQIFYDPQYFSDNNNNNNILKRSRDNKIKKKEEEEEERVGVLLDYVGQYGSLIWVPSCTDLLGNFTLCCYSRIVERCDFFLEVFTSSRNLKDLKEKMRMKGYRFSLKIC